MPPLPGYTAPRQRRKQLLKHPPSQFRSSSAPAPCGKWQHQLLSLVTVNSSPWGDVLLLDESTVAQRGQWRGYSLGSRVVQLVLSGAVETSLDPIVSPQSPDDIGQVLWHDALLLSSGGECKQLPSIILQG